MNAEGNYHELRVENSLLKSKIEALKNLSSSQISGNGKVYFENLVLNINREAGSDYSYIGRFVENFTIKTIAIADNSGLKENFNYKIETGTDTISSEDEAIQSFHQFIGSYNTIAYFKNTKFSSCIFSPLFDSGQKSIGVVVALFKNPPEDSQVKETIISLYARLAERELNSFDVISGFEEQLNSFTSLQNECYFEKNLYKKQLVKSIRIEEELRLANEHLAIVNSLLERKEKIVVEAQRIARFGYFEFDIKTASWTCSDVVEQILGIDNNYILDKHEWFKVIHPDNSEAIVEYYRKNILHKHQQFDRQVKIINRKSKTEKWIHVIAKLRFDKESNPEKLFGTIQDITEQMVSEEVKNSTQSNLNALIESTSDLIMSIDKNFNLITINSTSKIYIKKLLKIKIAVNQSIFKLIPSNQHDIWQKNFQDVFMGRNLKIEQTFTDTDLNENFFFEITINPIKLNKIVTGAVIFMRDISDRKKTEIHLIENEKRYRTIIEGANDIVLIADARSGEIIDVNKKFEELTGRKRKEIIGIHHTKLYPPSETPEMDAEFRKDVQATSKPVLKVVHLLTRNGSTIPVELNPSKYNLDDGSEHIVGFFRDIRDRLKTAEALEESLTKYKTLADFTYDWEYWKLPDNRYEYVSPSCKRITGFQSEDFYKDPLLFTSLIYDEDKEIWHRHEKDSLNRITCYEPVEFRIKTRDGKIKWINHVCQPVYNNHGVFLGNRGTNRDITSHKQSQLDLIESENRFKQLANLAFDGILIHNEGKILDINNAWTKITGYSKAELKGKNLVSILIPPKYKEAVNRFLKSALIKPHELELIRKDGKIIPVEFTTQLIKNKKSELRVVSIKDITEQKHHQQKILQTIIQTEEKERRRIAQELHDGLGPVLSTIKLYTETYLKSDNEAFKQKIKEPLLTGIDDALQQISAISNNLSPHILSDFGLKVAIQKFIEKVMHITAIKFEYNYKFSGKLDNNIEITLYRIAIELINNTIKHANATLIRLGIKQTGNSVYMYFENNGKGFNFDKTKETKKGMGLFNIINRIQSLNGSVAFENQDGKGILYVFTIPLKN